jgi:hypothetical protein
MNGSEGFPRRTRPTRPRAGPKLRAAAPAPFPGPARGETTNEARDIARYVADMAAQLEAMSEAAELELLAYFLSMARAEAEMVVHRADSEAETRTETEFAER